MVTNNFTRSAFYRKPGIVQVRNKSSVENIIDENKSDENVQIKIEPSIQDGGLKSDLTQNSEQLTWGKNNATYSDILNLSDSNQSLKSVNNIENTTDTKAVENNLNTDESFENDILKLPQTFNGTNDHSSVPAVYAGSVQILDYGNTFADGRTFKARILDPETPRIHPFDGLSFAQGRTARSATGQRLHLVISRPETDGSEVTLYVGEAKLNWWGNECKFGMRIKLRLDAGPEGADWHPMNGLHADQKDGEVVFLACWAIADDETVSTPQKAKRSHKPWSAEKSAVQQANMKCLYDENFRKWCATEATSYLTQQQIAELPDFQTDPKGFAAQVVRNYCGISSRSMLSHDTAVGLAARNNWREMLRLFYEWQTLYEKEQYYKDDPGQE